MLLQCNTGVILQSIGVSEDQIAYGAKFEKVKCSENQIAKNRLTTFYGQYADKTVTHWNNQKGRRMHQGKRKEYKKPNSSWKSREKFNMESFTLDIDDDKLTTNNSDDFSGDEGEV